MLGNHGGIFLSTQPWNHMNKGPNRSKSLNDSKQKQPYWIAYICILLTLFVKQ